MTVTEHEPTTISTLDEETRRVLVRAKGILANGWCQGEMIDGDSRCIMGALIAAGGRPKNMHDVLAPLAGVPLHDEVGACEIVPLARWNDEIGRTVDEVVGLIDRALQQ